MVKVTIIKKTEIIISWKIKKIKEIKKIKSK